MAYRVLDPLAQSFFIEQPTVLTKVDLFFSAKDSSLPVVLQIRKNVNGVPGPYVVPLSETVVYPASVLTSSNANVATTVSFTNPIFLDSGEYSLTLGSDSSNYRVWVSELGQTDTVTNKRITEQPYVGSLYKAQNASAYTPVQTEDLKFRMYRAKFQTNVAPVIEFTVSEDDRLRYLNKNLENDPLEVFPNSNIMRVHHTNHGMNDGSFVKFNGVSNARIFGNVFNNFYNVNAALIVDTTYSISNTTFNSYTVVLPNASTATVPTRFGGVSVYASQDLKYDLVYPVVSAISQNGTIGVSLKGTSTSYSVESDYTKLVLGDNELTEPKILAGNVTTTSSLSGAQSLLLKVNLTTDNQYSAPIIDTKQLGVVLVENLINSPSAASENILYDYITVSANQVANVYSLSSNTGLISFSDANDTSNARSLIKGTNLVISGSNPNNGTYRIVDVLDSGANVKVFSLSGVITSDINGSNNYTAVNSSKYIAEEASTDGSAFSKYITRQIDFLNSSTSLNTRIDVAQPEDSLIEFYYKTKFVGESELLSDKEFTRINSIAIPTSLSGEYYEVEAQLDNLQPFNAVIFKVVFKSTNSARVPKIKNLRLIALE